jgi:hypothetical protein
MIMKMEKLVKWLAGETKYAEKTCLNAALSTTNTGREPGPPRWKASN